MRTCCVTDEIKCCGFDEICGDCGRVAEILRALEDWQGLVREQSPPGVPDDLLMNLQGYLAEWAIVRAYAAFEETLNRWVEQRVRADFSGNRKTFEFLRGRLQGKKFVESLRREGLKKVFEGFDSERGFEVLVGQDGELNREWQDFQSLVTLRHALAHQGSQSSPPTVDDVAVYLKSGWRVVTQLGLVVLAAEGGGASVKDAEV